MTQKSPKCAIIGAGPAGLASARALSKAGIDFRGFEQFEEVGGLWNIDNPKSTVYESAHLISSKTKTQFSEFPMGDSVPDYPSHRQLRKYFTDFADSFGLTGKFQFNANVTRVEPEGDGWQLSWQAPDGLQTEEHFDAVLLANGTLSEPNLPQFEGSFDGEIIHSSEYKSPRVFANKRTLIVGAGNSGCDIAVDAVHHARSVAMSVRRGYHFVPKYVFGKPADTLGGLVPLPRAIKQFVDSKLLKLFTGDPVRFGFPAADHKLYESHPIVNSLVLHHLGHGDLTVLPDIARLDGDSVVFKDQRREPFDLIVLATGYKLHYPFIDKKHLNWQGAAPALYLNTFHPRYNNLFVMGMVEAAGIGWQGRMEQAEMVAAFIAGVAKSSAGAGYLIDKKAQTLPDMRGGFDYIKLDRMAYYVHNETFRRAMREHLRALTQGD